MNLYYLLTLSALTTLLTLNVGTHAVFSMDDDIAKEPPSTTNTINPLFSDGQKQQLKALKKMSPEDVMKSRLSSNDWYSRNHARGVVALLKRNAGKDEEAYSLIITAHKEGYAPASLELAQLALQKGESTEAHIYFRQALKSFIASNEDVPEDTRKEFAKSLVNFARFNHGLDMLEEYSEADSLLIYKPKSKKVEIVTDEEEDYDDLDFGGSMTLRLQLPASSNSDDNSDSEVDFDFGSEDEDGFESN